MTAPQRNPEAVCGTCAPMSRWEAEAAEREGAYLDSLIPQDEDGACL